MVCFLAFPGSRVSPVFPESQVIKMSSPGSQVINMGRFPLFTGSQVIKMNRFPVFPGSQVIGMDRFPVFPGSQVIKMIDFPVFPGSQVIKMAGVRICSQFCIIPTGFPCKMI